MPAPGAAAETVTTTSGVVRGATADTTFAYKRVPYAAPPTRPLHANGPDLSVLAMFQTYWSRFARTGDPAGTPPWPVYTSATDPTLVLDATASTTNGIRTTNCDFWAQF
jgi:carboxylesterase type B